jgi:hypothetical protein
LLSLLIYLPGLRPRSLLVFSCFLFLFSFPLFLSAFLTTVRPLSSYR